MANSATPIPRRRNRGSRGSPFPLTPPAPSSLRRTTSARRHERPVPALPSRRHQGAPPSGRRHVNLGAGRYIKWAPSMRPRAPGPLRRAMHGPSLLAQRRTRLVRDLLRGSGHPDFRRGTKGKKNSPAVVARGVDCRWLRGQDSNLRPSGYEPDELPDCSTPRQGQMTGIRGE